MKTKQKSPVEIEKAIPKVPRGRPSKFTQKTADMICAELCSGKPLTLICRKPGMPCPDMVRNWTDSVPGFASRYSIARDVGFDSIAESVLEIADDLTDEPASRRVRIDTRLKLLAKWDPKRYGDKVVVEREGPMDIVVTIGGDAD